uniref:P-type Cu(+) transporter n=1 Tax=Araucaria cunninghamii TaxID=56994 RepID=A0A0D6QYX4_ARACU
MLSRVIDIRLLESEKGILESESKDELKSPLLSQSSEHIPGSPSSQTDENVDLNVLEVRKVTFHVSGMECASCAGQIEKGLKKLHGIKDATVALLQNKALVLYWPTLVDKNKIKEAIEDAGFEAKLTTDCTEDTMATCRFRIRGMTCTSCSESLSVALERMKGVKKALVALALEEGKIYYDPKQCSIAEILQTVADAGFESDLINVGDETNKVLLKLEGVSSSEEAKLIEVALQLLPGVNSIEMDPNAEKVSVSYDPDLTGPRSIIQCIQQAGPEPNYYRASIYNPPGGRDSERQKEIKHYKKYFLWSCVFSVPVFFLSMVFPMISPWGDLKLVNMLTLGKVLRWVLCTPIQFIIGRRFYIGAYHALHRGSANMDVLVALGTNAAYFYSVYTLLKSLTSQSFKGQDFFETSALLISFILLGKYLEVLAKGKTSDAIAKLMNLAPDTATLLTIDDDGNVTSEMEISSQLIQRNDIIRVVPGAKVPTDGIVIRGQSHVNESMITGEARPVAKRPGDKVIGGTMNESGFLLVKATHVGSETALSQIVQLVEAAQMAKAPVQKLADRVSRFFVPLVVVAAFITWLGWFIPGETGIFPRGWIPESMDGFELALQFGISVLVIACPCALGLATPTAVMVATGIGASQGVLIKGGNALESAHKVKCIVFDKTGTLTIGRPVVIGTKLFTNIAFQEFCDMAAATEANSEHPLAKAVVEYNRKLRVKYGLDQGFLFEAQDFQAFPGKGVQGTVLHKKILIGNRRLMVDSDVHLAPEVEEHLQETEQLAKTCVLMAIDREIAGAFTVADPVKPEAETVVSILKSMGITSIMVTGDNWGIANAIAGEVGIEIVFAETEPLGKAERVKELQMKGMTVAMVGDGINDSPALVAANVGMAIGAGTDVAIEAADIVLMKSNLEDVITGIDLAKKTISRIHLNYVWALGYNVMGIPIAAGVLFPSTGIRLPPWLAGACMAASSVSVVCSSLLLQSYKKPKQLRSLHTETAQDNYYSP